MSARTFIRRFLQHAVLALIAVFALAPFLWMVSTSLKPPSEILTSALHFFPMRFHGYENYRDAFTTLPLGPYLLTGPIVTSATFSSQVLVALPAAYALAKLRFWGRDVAFAAVLFCILIPFPAIAVPLFLLLHALGLLNSYAALVVPFTISAFGIFLM